MTFDVTDELI